MKQIKKRVQTLLLLGSLIPFGANAQNEKLTEKEIESKVVRNFYANKRQNIESTRLEYVIPDSFYKAYTENLGYNLDVFEVFVTNGRKYTLSN